MDADQSNAEEAEADGDGAPDWPLWHYDENRCNYWYFCADNNAYFLYQENPQTSDCAFEGNGEPMRPDGAESDGLGAATWPLWYYDENRCNYWYFCAEYNAYFLYEASNDQHLEAGASCYENQQNNHSIVECVENHANNLPESLPASNWVEDFLIEEYLRGSSAEMSGGFQCANNSDATSYEDGLNNDDSEIEAWKAQYGQVVRSSVEDNACPQAINLWNWTTTAHLKRKNTNKIRLIGQIAAVQSRLHPSIQNNGYIKSSRVCAVNLDLVKVLSGEVYRLKQPSPKYLSSLLKYDSSNPTKDWDFPIINFDSFPNQTEVPSPKLSENALIAKPFVPNLNHKRFENLKKRKASEYSHPPGLWLLSENEISSARERSQKYRDRAKERRRYGKDMDSHNSGCNLNEDVVNDFPNGSKMYSTAKHMLERMGWNEGEPLGKQMDGHGLLKPLCSTSNNSRAGVGWVANSQ